jgi:hypothetical protein
MVHYGDDKLATNFLSKDDIRAIAPKVLLTKPSNPNLSNRYTYASTERVIDDLAKLGWLPVDAKQQKMRKESSVRSFHIVSFQNPNVCIRRTDYVDAEGRNYAFSRVVELQDENGNVIGYEGHDRYGHAFPVFKQENVEAYPRIILTNSYDGFNSFTFRVGLFRLVCSNGLVVCTEQFVDISVRHIGYTEEKLREIVASAITAVDSQIGTFNDMRKVYLTDEQKAEFALSALRYRKGLADDAEMKADDEGIADLLTPIRDEDNDNSLWAVFNILQEKVTKGGAVVGINGKKARKMRAIKSFAKDIDINQRLYKTALSYLPIAV